MARETFGLDGSDWEVSVDTDSPVFQTAVALGLTGDWFLSTGRAFVEQVMAEKHLSESAALTYVNDGNSWARIYRRQENSGEMSAQAIGEDEE